MKIFMMNENIKKAVEALDTAASQHIDQCFDRYVEEGRRMCALSAIYYICTGIVPVHFNSQLHIDLDQFQKDTGIDLRVRVSFGRSYVSMYRYLVRENDVYRQDFTHIARRLEYAQPEEESQPRIRFYPYSPSIRACTSIS